MSEVIDDQVVQLEFDNSQFQEGIEESLESIRELENSLSFKGGTDGLKDVAQAVDKVDMSKISDQLDQILDRFGALGTVIHNIQTKIISSAGSIAKAISIDPIVDGFREYETQMGSIQTILANTQKYKTTLDDVNGALDTLNKYADKTIYNFTEMTKNIGTFTAAGIDLDSSTKAIQGIANLAAVSGSTSQQASNAMYQLSQALAAGKVSLQDWNSVVNANMGGEVFQDALKRTSRVLGTGVDAAIEKYGTFRESLTQGEWLTKDVLTETLNQLALDVSTAEKYNAAIKDLVSSGYTEEEAQEIADLADTATKAATEVKTFSMLIDTLKEAMGSGWTSSWEYVIGNFEEAKELWTGLSDTIGGAIGSISDFQNESLKYWHDTKIVNNETGDAFTGRESVIEGLKNIANVIKDVLASATEGLSNLFGIMSNGQRGFGDVLLDLSNSFRKLTENIQLTEGQKENIRDLFTAIAQSIRVAINAAMPFVNVFGSILKTISPIIPVLVSMKVASAAFNPLVNGLKSIASVGTSVLPILGGFSKFNVLKTIAVALIPVIGRLVTALDSMYDITGLLTAISTIVSSSIGIIGDSIGSLLTSITGVPNVIDSIVVVVLNGILGITEAVLSLANTIVNGEGNFGERLAKAFGDLFAPIINGPIKVIASGIQNAFSNVLSEDLFKDAYNTISNFIKNLTGIDISGVGEKISDFFSGILEKNEFISEFFGKVKTWFESLSNISFTGVFSEIRDFFTWLVSTIQTLFSFKPNEAVASTIESVTETVGAISDSFEGSGKGLTEVFEPITDQLAESASTSLDGMVASAKETAQELNDAVTDSFEPMADQLSSKVGENGEKFVENASTSLDGMVASAKETAKQLNGVVVDAANANDKLENVKGTFVELKGIAKVAKDFIQPYAEELGELITHNWSNIFNTLDATKLLVTIGVLAKIKKLIKQVTRNSKTIAESISAPFTGLGNLLTSYSKVQEELAKTQKANRRAVNASAVKDIIVSSMAIISAFLAAYYVFEKEHVQLDPKKLLTLGAVFTGVIAGVAILNLAYAKFLKAKSDLVKNQNDQDANSNFGIFAPFKAGLESIGNGIKTLSKGLSKIGNGLAILGVAATMGTLLASISSMKKMTEDYANMDMSTFVSGASKIALVIGTLSIAMVAIGKASKGAGAAMLGVGPALATFMLSMAAFFGAIKLYSFVDSLEYINGLIKVLGAVGVMVAALGATALIVNKSNASFKQIAATVIELNTIMAALGMMILAIKAYSMMSADTYFKGLTKLIGSLAVVIASLYAINVSTKTGGLRNMLLSMVVMITTVSSITKAIKKLSKIDDDKLTKASLCLGSIMALVTTMLTSLTGVGAKGKLATLLGVTASVAALTAIIKAMTQIEDKKLILTTTAVNTVVITLTFLVNALEKLSNSNDAVKSVLAFAGSLVIAVAGIGLVVGALSKFSNLDGAFEAAKSIGLVLVAASFSLAQLTKAGTTWYSGAKEAVNLLEFVGILGGVFGGLGALVNYLEIGDSVMSALDTADKFIVKFAEMIGHFYGGVLGGFAGQVKKTFTNDTEGLASFSEWLSAVVEAASGIGTQFSLSASLDEGINFEDNSLVSFAKGVKKLSEAMADLSIDKVALPSLEEFSSIAIFVGDLIDEASSISTQYSTLAGGAKLGPVAGFLFNYEDSSFYTFAKGISKITNAISSLKFENDGSTIKDYEDSIRFVERLINAGKDIPTQTKSIYGFGAFTNLMTKTFGGGFFSSNEDSSLETFAYGLSAVISKLNKSNLDKLKLPSSESLEKISNFVVSMATAASKIGAQTKSTLGIGGGNVFGSAFAGGFSHHVDSSFETFAKGLEEVIGAFSKLDIKEKDIPSDDAINSIISYVSGMVSAAENIQTQVKSTFGAGISLSTLSGGFFKYKNDSSLKTFAEGLVDVNEAFSGLSFKKLIPPSDEVIDSIVRYTSGMVNAAAKIKAQTITAGGFAESGLGSVFAAGAFFREDSSLYTFAKGMKSTAESFIQLGTWNSVEPPKEEVIDGILKYTKGMVTAARDIKTQYSLAVGGAAAGPILAIYGEWMDQSLSTFAEGMHEAADSFMSLGQWNNVIPPKQETVDSIVDYTSRMIEAASGIKAQTKNVVSGNIFTGINNTFEDGSLKTFAEGMSKISESLTSENASKLNEVTISPLQVQRVASCISYMAIAASNIPDMHTKTGLFSNDDNTITNFAKQMAIAAPYIAVAGSRSKEIDLGSIEKLADSLTCTIRAINTIGEDEDFQNNLFNLDYIELSLSQLADAIKPFGEGIKALVDSMDFTETGYLDTTKIEQIPDFLRAISEVSAELGDANPNGDFTNLIDWINEFKNIDIEVDDLEGVAESLEKIANNGVNAIAETFESADTARVQSAIGKIIADAISGLNNTGIDGETSTNGIVERLADTLIDSDTSELSYALGYLLNNAFSTGVNDQEETSGKIKSEDLVGLVTTISNAIKEAPQYEISNALQELISTAFVSIDTEILASAFVEILNKVTIANKEKIKASGHIFGVYFAKGIESAKYAVKNSAKKVLKQANDIFNGASLSYTINTELSTDSADIVFNDSLTDAIDFVRQETESEYSNNAIQIDSMTIEPEKMKISSDSMKAAEVKGTIPVSEEIGTEADETVSVEVKPEITEKGVEETLDSLKNTISNTDFKAKISTLKTDASNLVNDIQGHIDGARESLQVAVKEASDSDFVQSLKDKVSNVELKAKVTTFENAASDLVEDVQNAINDNGIEVQVAVEGVLTSMTNGMPTEKIETNDIENAVEEKSKGSVEVSADVEFEDLDRTTSIDDRTISIEAEVDDEALSESIKTATDEVTKDPIELSAGIEIEDFDRTTSGDETAITVETEVEEKSIEKVEETVDNAIDDIESNNSIEIETKIDEKSTDKVIDEITEKLSRDHTPLSLDMTSSIETNARNAAEEALSELERNGSVSSWMNQISDFFGNSTREETTKAATAITATTEELKELIDSIPDEYSDPINTYVDTYNKKIDDEFANGKIKLKQADDLKNEMIGLVYTTIHKLKNANNEITDTVSELMDNIYNGTVKEPDDFKLIGTIEEFKSAIESIPSSLKDPITTTVNDITEEIDALVNSGKITSKQAENFKKDLWNTVLSSLNSARGENGKIKASANEFIQKIFGEMAKVAKNDFDKAGEPIKNSVREALNDAISSAVTNRSLGKAKDEYIKAGFSGAQARVNEWVTRDLEGSLKDVANTLNADTSVSIALSTLYSNAVEDAENEIKNKYGKGSYGAEELLKEIISSIGSGIPDEYKALVDAINGSALPYDASGLLKERLGSEGVDGYKQYIDRIHQAINSVGLTDTASNDIYKQANTLVDMAVKGAIEHLDETKGIGEYSVDEYLSEMYSHLADLIETGNISDDVNDALRNSILSSTKTIPEYIETGLNKEEARIANTIGQLTSSVIGMTSSQFDNSSSVAIRMLGLTEEAQNNARQKLIDAYGETGYTLKQLLSETLTEMKAMLESGGIDSNDIPAFKKLISAYTRMTSRVKAASYDTEEYTDKTLESIRRTKDAIISQTKAQGDAEAKAEKIAYINAANAKKFAEQEEQRQEEIGETTNSLSALTESLGGTGSKLLETGSELLGGLKGKFKETMPGVVDTVGDALGGITDKISSGAEAGTGLIGDLVENGKQLISGLNETKIVPQVDTDAVEQAISDFDDALYRIKYEGTTNTQALIDEKLLMHKSGYDEPVNPSKDWDEFKDDLDDEQLRTMHTKTYAELAEIYRKYKEKLNKYDENYFENLAAVNAAILENEKDKNDAIGTLQDEEYEKYERYKITHRTRVEDDIKQLANQIKKAKKESDKYEALLDQLYKMRFGDQNDERYKDIQDKISYWEEHLMRDLTPEEELKFIENAIDSMDKGTEGWYNAIELRRQKLKEVNDNVITDTQELLDKQSRVLMRDITPSEELRIWEGALQLVKKDSDAYVNILEKIETKQKEINDEIISNTQTAMDKQARVMMRELEPEEEIAYWEAAASAVEVGSDAYKEALENLESARKDLNAEKLSRAEDYWSYEKSIMELQLQYTEAINGTNGSIKGTSLILQEEELAYWKNFIGSVQYGSEQYKTVMQKISDLQLSIQSERISAAKEESDTLEDIYKTNANAIAAAYRSEYESIKETIKGSFDISDAFDFTSNRYHTVTEQVWNEEKQMMEYVEKEVALTWDDLVKNAQTYVYNNQNWNKQLEYLSSLYGADDPFFQYLKDLGPSAAGYVEIAFEEAMKGASGSYDELRQVFIDNMDLSEEAAKIGAASQLAYQIAIGKIGSSEDQYSEFRNNMRSELTQVSDETKDRLIKLSELCQKYGVTLSSDLLDGVSEFNSESGAKLIEERLNTSIKGMLDKLLSEAEEYAKNKGGSVSKEIYDAIADGDYETALNGLLTMLNGGKEISNTGTKLADNIASGVTGNLDAVKEAGKSTIDAYYESLMSEDNQKILKEAGRNLANSVFSELPSAPQIIYGAAASPNLSDINPQGYQTTPISSPVPSTTAIVSGSDIDYTGGIIEGETEDVVENTNAVAINTQEKRENTQAVNENNQAISENRNRISGNVEGWNSLSTSTKTNTQTVKDNTEEKNQNELAEEALQTATNKSADSMVRESQAIQEMYGEYRNAITETANEATVISKAFKESSDAEDKNTEANKKNTRSLEENVEAEKEKQNAIKQTSIYNAEASTVYSNLQAKIERLQRTQMRTFTNKEQLSWWQENIGLIKEGTDAYAEASNKIEELQRSANDEIVSTAETALSKKKRWHTVSLSEEIAYWQSILKTAKAGSDAYEDILDKIDELRAEAKKESDAALAEAEEEAARNAEDAAQQAADNARQAAEDAKQAQEEAEQAREKAEQDAEAARQKREQEETEARNKYMSLLRHNANMASAQAFGVNTALAQYEVYKNANLGIISKDEETLWNYQEQMASLQGQVNSEIYSNLQSDLSHRKALQDISTEQEIEYWRNRVSALRYGSKEYNEIIDKIDELQVQAIKERQEAYIKDTEDYISDIGIERMKALSNEEQKAIWENLLAEASLDTERLEQVYDKIASLNQSINSERISNAETDLSKLKRQRDVSLSEEIRYWDNVKATVKEGSEAYEKAIDKIDDAHWQLKRGIEELTDTFNENVEDLKTDLIDKIDDIWESYEDAIKSKADSLSSAMGLFQFFESQTYETSYTLLDNLNSQVEGFKDYQNNMKKIAARGATEELMEDLESAGPSNNANLEAMLRMTDEQWNEYISLYRQKRDLASSIAREEVNKDEYSEKVDDAIKDSQERLDELVEQYQKNVEKYGATLSDVSISIGSEIVDGITEGIENNGNTLMAAVENVINDTLGLFTDSLDVAHTISDKTYDIGKEFREQFNNNETIVQPINIEYDPNYTYDNIVDNETLVSSAYNAGTQVSNGFAAGIRSNRHLATEAAYSTAETVTNTVYRKLDIHSPSGVFEEIGENCDKGMAKGLTEFAFMVSDSANDVAEDAIDSYGWMVSKVIKAMDSLKISVPIVSSGSIVDNILDSIVEQIQNATSFTKDLNCITQEYLMSILRLNNGSFESFIDPIKELGATLREEDIASVGEEKLTDLQDYLAHLKDTYGSGFNLDNIAIGDKLEQYESIIGDIYSRIKDASTIAESIRLDGLKNSIEYVNNLDVEALKSAPTITPVVDMSKVLDSVRSISNMFDNTYYIDAELQAKIKNADWIQSINIPSGTASTRMDSTMRDMRSLLEKAKGDTVINNSFDNNFDIKSNNPREVAYEVSRIIQNQVRQKEAMWS